MTPEIGVTVRFFAAARAAAGSDSEHLTVGLGATIDDLVDRIGAGNGELERVLLRCSFLCDGVAVRDRTRRLQAGDLIDVLPPFAGG